MKFNKMLLLAVAVAVTVAFSMGALFTETGPPTFSEPIVAFAADIDRTDSPALPDELSFEHDADAETVATSIDYDTETRTIDATPLYATYSAAVMDPGDASATTRAEKRST